MANESVRSDERTGSREENRTAIERSSSSSPSRRMRSGGDSPFTLMRRLSEDMDRLFGEFFGGRSALGFRGSAFGESTTWPEIEAFRRGDKFVIRADVPGMNKEDVRVEVVDDELCISGERRSESEQTEGDYYAAERSYGAFCRTIPLPHGAKADTASASFDKGVLEIEMEVPAETGRGRRIEVREQPSH